MPALLENQSNRIRSTGSSLPRGFINKEIDTKVSEVDDHIHSSVSNGQVRSIRNEIFDVYFECNTDNWDSYDAKAVQKQSVQKLLFILDNYIPVNLITKPEIAPDPDGTIGFEWFGDKGYRMIIIPKGEKILYAALLGEREFHGKSDLGEGLPPEVLNILCYYFHK